MTWKQVLVLNLLWCLHGISSVERDVTFPINAQTQECFFETALVGQISCTGKLDITIIGCYFSFSWAIPILSPSQKNTRFSDVDNPIFRARTRKKVALFNLNPKNGIVYIRFMWISTYGFHWFEYFFGWFWKVSLILDHIISRDRINHLRIVIIPYHLMEAIIINEQGINSGVKGDLVPPSFVDFLSMEIFSVDFPGNTFWVL